MSTLVVTTCKTDTVQTTGATHSSTPEQIKNGRAKAWWDYNQQTPAITNSFGISSITDSATGVYIANFSDTLTDPCAVTSGSWNDSVSDGGHADYHNAMASNTTCSVRTWNGHTNYDLQHTYGVIFDDG